jgi:uncharacterized delta-60 repeat protein
MWLAVVVLIAGLLGETAGAVSTSTASRSTHRSHHAKHRKCRVSRHKRRGARHRSKCRAKRHPHRKKAGSGGRPPYLGPPGTLDRSFGVGGVSNVAIGTWAGAVAAAVQPDLKVVTVGEAGIGGQNELVSTRMNRDGSLDPSYGNGGVATFALGGDSGGNAIALLPDGKILLAGASKDAKHILSFTAVRLLPNGTLDPTFGNGGFTTIEIGSASIVNAVGVQPDGKVVLGGTANTGKLEFAAARLTPSGAIDTSFGQNGVTKISTAGAAWGMALQRDGDIVLAGETGSTLGLGLLAPLLPKGPLTSLLGYGLKYMAARLLPNGSLDPSFGSGGLVKVAIGQSAIAFALAAQPDGKLVLAGNAFSGNVLQSVARLLPSGALDHTFGGGGLSTLTAWQGVNAMTLQRNGAILLAEVGPTVTRLGPGGGIDQSFGDHGKAGVSVGSKGAANGVTLEADHKIILAGSAQVDGQLVLTVIRMWI